VAGDLRSPVQDLERDFTEIYLPFGAASIASTFGLRCGEACPSEGLIRQRLTASVPGVDVSRVGRLDQNYRRELAQPRAMATLGLLFSVLALTVATGGLFSVMSHAVGRRRREFGIRIVLGSSPGSIRRLVLRDGLSVVVMGIVLGSIVSWLATGALRSLVYGVTAADPLTWGAVAMALALAAIAGAWRPARQAMRVDPAVLLRDE
jgi:ABC-type antimicrobial peptide transport system permease subunit